MAGDSTTTPSLSGSANDVDQFIDRQLRVTRQRVKLIDVAGVGLLAMVGSLAYLFALVLVDHWLVAGGLSSTARFGAFAVLAVVWGYFAARQLLPTLLGRVNPLYAAEQIERSRPTLKNSLINFLQLRSRAHQLNPSIFQAIEHRAANDLSTIEIEHSIDRSRLVKLGYALAVIITLGALYKVISPKDPLRSMGRMIVPWADWSAPTRTNIADVSPGDTQDFISRRVKISCRVTGLWNEEPVTLIYSTADGQEVDRRLTMAKADEANRYFVELPDSSTGLQQDLVYAISAGDARTRSFAINVVTVPAIVVQQVKYKYPAYTLLGDAKGERVVERQGDLRAIEGTVAQIDALANDEIRSATLRYERSGGKSLAMQVQGRRATVGVSLNLKAGTLESEHRSYQLSFTNAAGAVNPTPIEHKIEVIADEKPTVAIVEPSFNADEPIEMPLGRALQLGVSARDPDFRLGSVTVVLDKAGNTLREPLLVYDSKQPEQNRPSRFDGAWLLDSAALKDHKALKGLNVGDLVGVVVEATDNKQPKPNLARSERLQVRIVSPSAEPPKQPDQLAKNDPPKNEPNQDGSGKNQADPNNKDKQPGKPDGKQGDSKSGQPGENKQPGDNKQPGQNDPKQSGGSKGDNSQQNKSGSSKDQDQGGQPSGEPKPGDKQQDKNSGQQGDQKAAGANDSQGGGMPPEEANSGDKPKSGQGNRQPSGAKQDGAGQGGDGEKRTDPDSDPGGAIDKILKHFGDDKQLAKNEPRPGAEQPQDKSPAGDDKPGQTKDGQQPPGDPNGGQRAGDQGGQKDPNGVKSTPKDDLQSGSKSGSREGSKSPDKKTDADPNNGKPTETPAGPQPGNAGQTGEGQPKQSQPQQGDPKRNDNQSGDASTKGNQGAGQAGDDKQSTTSPQGANKPRDKAQPNTPNSGDKKSDGSSPSRSQNESDSRGDSSGDQSGGGKQGGGQQSSQAGTGGAGTNTAADQGGSQTAGKGDGPTSDKGGDQAKADKTTDGKSSGEKGTGSKSQPGGDKQGGSTKGSGSDRGKGDAGKPGEPTEGKPGEPKDSTKQTGKSGSQAGGSSGDPVGGGLPGEREIPPESLNGPEPGGEDPNLEYARKATQLALQRLKDQLAKGEPDPELLKRLKWTKEDAQRFVDRWQAMMQSAQENNPAGNTARRELDETLRSLGLRPTGTQLKGDRATSDNQRGLREGLRSAPPAEYADQFKAYTSGTGKKTQ